MSIDNKIRKIDPNAPDPNLIRKAAKIVSEGEAVVFPTTCLYGLAANCLDPQAVSKIFRMKNRDARKPLSVLIKDLESLDRIAGPIGDHARILMEKFWPGNLTIILPANRILPETLTGGKHTIGVRFPRHRVARDLTEMAETPVTATSANLSGYPGCSDIRKLTPGILRRCELVLDAGILEGGAGSTVVDASGPKIRVLRVGKIPAVEIFDVLAKP